MKTLGEIEAAVSAGISHFQQDYMGRGPKVVTTHLIDDLVLIRLKGALSAAEQDLVQTPPVEKGRDLLKQVRIQCIEKARPRLEHLIEDVTSEKVLSLHHDISPATGEELVLFILARPPAVRDLKRKSHS